MSARQPAPALQTNDAHFRCDNSDYVFFGSSAKIKTLLKNKKNFSPLSAIVLAKTLTGLATLRALAALDIDLHAVIFNEDEAIMSSRYGKKVLFPHGEHNEPALLAFLTDYCQTLGTMPVIIPTSDSLALFLAKHQDVLKPICTLWTTSYENLAEIINKNGLYHLAEQADVATIPWVETASLEELKHWSQANAAPYLLKPFYAAADTARPFGKNWVVDSRDALLAYATTHGTEAIVIQRMVVGGDGYIFDTYGYCDAQGRIVTMASHRRWRQQPPDLGSTSFGEIPANFTSDTEGTIFSATTRLLAKTKYHGIFGIEWLYDHATKQFYLIDFNARPFSSIGHLQACGMNLPAMAYRDLAQQVQGPIEARPQLKHLMWMDFFRDLDSLRTRKFSVFAITKIWLQSIIRCRSFAYQSLADPAPALHEWRLVLRRLAKYFFSNQP